MKDFHYRGQAPASKSLWIRARLAASYSPGLILDGSTTCADARHFDESLLALTRGTAANVGEAGLGLRLVALRAARIPGRHRIDGTERLFARPQVPLLNLLHRLGIDARLEASSLQVTSSGWKAPSEPIVIDRATSSQFASALLLNAWELPFALDVKWAPGARVSDGYWRMSVTLARSLGMVVDETDDGITLAPDQRLTASRVAIEPDLSSTFSLAAFAALRGSATFVDFPTKSLQPDRAFVEILASLGADVTRGSDLVVTAKTLRPVDVDLNGSPDLFPVLGVLAGQAAGTSHLRGAPHLVHKESDRLAQTEALLGEMGRTTRRIAGGLAIEGKAFVGGRAFTFDAQGDHRMAMAAAVARYAGFAVQIAHPESVEKSFPEFWSVIEEATS